MKLLQRFQNIIKRLTERREPPMKHIPPDTDTPKEMGRSRRGDSKDVGTTHSVKDTKGNRVCGRCGSEIITLNEIIGSEACTNIECGAKIVDE